LKEWLEELAQLEKHLAQKTPLPTIAIPALERVLGILDEELTAAFNRLYSRLRQGRCMSSYRVDKTAELDLLFDWLAEELRQLRKSNPDHAVLLDCLDQEYKQAESKLALLQAILELNDPSLDKRADRISHDLSRYLIPTTNHYVAGLQRQGPQDRHVRAVLLKMCQRLRLDWIKDILVCLHRDLALLAEYRGNFSIPVFFGPPHLLEVILEVPGVYHEFGHSVFAKDDVFLHDRQTLPPWWTWVVPEVFLHTFSLPIPIHPIVPVS
jgi:hypothetical protein